MLKFDDITVFRDGKAVVSNVSFCLRPNRLTAVLGKNGSGKSTLVSCVTGQVRYHGDITLKERSLRKISAGERAMQIAVLPQILPSVPLTVEELTKMGRSPYLDISGRMTNKDISKVESALKAVGMTDFRNKYLNRLSGGEQQKAYLAMILAQDTDIVIFDEPTTYMDVENENELMTLLHRLKTVHRKTLMVVMHNLTCVAEIADDVLILDRGSMAFYGSKEECIANSVIESVFHVHRSTYEKDGKKLPLYY